MSDCRRTVERLASYTDGALPPAERADIDRHLAACPPCRAAAAQDSGGRAVLRDQAPRLKAEALPPGLRTRFEALARQHGRRRTPAWLTGLIPGIVTALVIVLAGSAVLSFVTHRSDTVLAAQLTADHMKCFRIFAHPDSPAVDQHDLEERLEDQYGWDIHVPPSSAQDGVQLIGARRCLYADGSIPHVMYRVHGQDVSLYMLEGVQRPPAEVMALGHRSRIWTRGATTYVMISAAPQPEFARAAAYVMQEAH